MMKPTIIQGSNRQHKNVMEAQYTGKEIVVELSTYIRSLQDGKSALSSLAYYMNRRYMDSY